jgi:hypothetical protein
MTVQGQVQQQQQQYSVISMPTDAQQQSQASGQFR